MYHIVLLIPRSLQKIPMRDLHATEKSGIVELALIMQTGVCPYIVEFYGCLIRDVSAVLYKSCSPFSILLSCDISPLCTGLNCPINHSKTSSPLTCVHSRFETSKACNLVLESHCSRIFKLYILIGLVFSVLYSEMIFCS